MTLLHSTPRSTSTKVSVGEVLQVGWVDSPVVPFAVLASTSFDETLVEGQVVANAVPPTLVLASVVRKLVGNVVVDVTK